MRFIKLMMTFVLVSLFAFVCAQDLKTIRGKVTNQNGEPIVGATVRSAVGNSSTSTDADGNYSLSVDPKNKIIVSFLTNKIEREVGNANTVDVILNVNDEAIEEVVVVGYGTQARSSVTGAVSSISKEVLENRPVTNSVAALQGASPGLTITRTSGRPGNEGWSAQIRGITTIGEQNSPLVIIDGVEGDLSSINPNDISNISILKDAAAAIYGAKAGAGVILVTTKSGGDRKTQVDLSSQLSFNRKYNVPELLSSREIGELNNVAQFNVNGTRPFSDEQLEWLDDPNVEYVFNESNKTYTYYYNNNLADILMRNSSPQQNHNVTLSGGNARSNFLASIGLFDQQGVFKFGPDNHTRYNTRLNYNAKLNNIFTFDAKLSYANLDTEEPIPNVEGDYSLMYEIYMIRNSRQPIFLPETNDTKYAYIGTHSSAYPQLRDGGGKYTKDHRMNGVFILNAKIMEGLNARLVYGPGLRTSNYLAHAKTIDRWAPNSDVPTGLLNNPNTVEKQRFTTTTQTFQAIVDYNTKLNDVHNIGALLGHEYNSYRYDYVMSRKRRLLINDFPSLNYTTDTQLQPDDNGDNIQANAFASQFGRFTYNYDQKYFVEGTIRRDGTSRLAPGFKNNVFYGISTAWNLGREEWFKAGTKIFDEFKIRASYNTAGGAQTSDLNKNNYQHQALLNNGSYPFNNSKTSTIFQNSLPSDDKAWEVIKMKNIGLDFAVLNNRLSASFDYYHRLNDNVFIQLLEPATLGVTPNNQNAASVSVKGWDFEVRWRGKFNKGGYFLSANLADNKNEVIRYEGNIALNIGNNANLLGYPINSIWGYRTDGYINTQEELETLPKLNSQVKLGHLKYLDLNGDSFINTGRNTLDDHGDLEYLGNTNPRYIFGINLGANWNGFDISAMFNGVGKRSMMLNPVAVIPFYEGWRQPWAIHKDYWTPENLDAKFPSLYVSDRVNTQMSSHWVQKANYIRLKNLQIGYTLPTDFTNKAKIGKARIFFSGQDLWEKTGMWFTYFDAENPNEPSYKYPMFRSYSFGVNLTF